LQPVVLIVVGDRHVCDVLRHWLEVAFPDGLVLEAYSAGDAVKRAHAHSPNIVLMDINTPGMPIAEAKRFIEATTPKVEVVLFSRTHGHLRRPRRRQHVSLRKQLRGSYPEFGWVSLN